MYLNMSTKKNNDKRNNHKYYYYTNSIKSQLIKSIDSTKKKNDKYNEKTIKVVNKQTEKQLQNSKKISQNTEKQLQTEKISQNIPIIFPHQNMQQQFVSNNQNQNENFIPFFPSISLIIKKNEKKQENDKEEDDKSNSKSLLPKPIIKKEFITIKENINSIDDLIKLIDKYPLKNTIEYNIDMDKLHNIKEPLIQLKNMIGMESLKKSVMYQILYYLQELHKNSKGDFLHTCIYGPPGTGKTEVAKILGSIFSKIGVLKKGSFKKVNRSDLIAGYLGQTAIKTNKVIDDALGGVLFIDEAYSLGNKDKKDIFSKECLDTLCEALSNHKDKLMVIIAGYKDELNDSFFSINPGLNSRFNWRYNIDKYNETELRDIFIKKIYDEKWTFDKDKLDSIFPIHWFKENIKYFKYFGRDIEILILKMKIAHSKRVFGMNDKYKKNFTNEDLVNGFELFCENENIKDRKYGGIPSYAIGMYT
jgi:SpoVK/Ycf46/Vps4 family AAA+-type ATPase